VRLFDADAAGLTTTMAANTTTLTLLPQSVRLTTKAVKDDF
jgi:hypothetical protein